MNNLLFEACVASQTEWVDSFESNTEHMFSKRHEKRMEELFSKINFGYRRLTKNTVRLIIIAAILLALTVVTAFGIQTALQSKTLRMNTETVYDAPDSDEHTMDDFIEIGYIPNSYKLTKIIDRWQYELKLYKLNNKSHFYVEKTILNFKAIYSVGSNPDLIIEQNGTVYNYYEKKDYSFIIWNTEKYIYVVSGDLPKEELFKVAYSTI